MAVGPTKVIARVERRDKSEDTRVYVESTAVYGVLRSTGT